MFIQAPDRRRSPFRQSLAIAGVSVLLLQLVAAAPAACESMHTAGDESSHAEHMDMGAHHGATGAHGMAPVADVSDSPDDADHPSPVACAMMNHCASWVPGLDGTPVGELAARTFDGLFAPTWHIHAASRSHLVPPPKV